MEILKVTIDEQFNLIIASHILLYSLLIVATIYWIYKVYKKRILSSNIEIESAEIGISGHKIKIKPNYINIDIAYQLWVELNTRKIGLLIDFENDVILEIYNSWYQFFGITRELLKNLPASKIRNDRNSKILIEISTQILNEGLRPHLTKWQAKYRKWHSEAIKNASFDGLTPQEIQKKFEGYELLKIDMQKINNNFIEYKKLVYQLAFGDEDAKK